jgi:hypothetical protein
MGDVSDKTIVCYFNVQYLLLRPTPLCTPYCLHPIWTTAGSTGAVIKLEMEWGVL